MENKDATLKREDEITDISKMSSLPTESKPHTLMEKVSETLSHLHLTSKNKEEITEKASEIKQEAKEKVEEAEIKPEEASKGLLGTIKQGIQNVSNIIMGKFHTTKEGTSEGQELGKSEEDQSLGEKIKEKAGELKDKITNKEGTEGFIKVKEGISEDAEEIRHQEQEEMQKELHSDNPFEALADSNTVIEENVEGKTMAEKIKDASNTISGKLTETKEKIKSAFVSTDKENAPQSTA